MFSQPPLLAAALGILLLLHWSRQAFFRWSVNPQVFVTVITKLLQKGAADRAVKFCYAVPGAPLADTLRALLLQTGLRSREESTISAVLRASFEDHYEIFRGKIAACRIQALTALTLVVVPLYYVSFFKKAHPGTFQIFLALLGLAVLLTLLNAWGSRRILRQVREGFEDFFPKYLAYLLQGETRD